MLRSLLHDCQAQGTKPAGPPECPLPPTASIPTLVLRLPPSLLQPGGKQRVLGRKVGGVLFLFPQKWPGHPTHEEAGEEHRVRARQCFMNKWFISHQSIHPRTPALRYTQNHNSLPLYRYCGAYFLRGESQVSKGDRKEIKVGWIRERGSPQVRQGENSRRWKRWRFLVTLRPWSLVQNIKMLKIKT